MMFHASKNWSFDRWIGNLSYPIYLVHASVLLFLQVRYISNGLIAIIFSTLVTVVLLVTVEQPLEQLRQRRASQSLDDGANLRVAASLIVPS
jgi:peptidoglycan/LPS O-acetylase OafA/YrhL